MTTKTNPRKARAGYHPTESKHKGGASEMYLTYDLDQRTRGGGIATYPKVKRVYIAGDVKDCKLGRVSKRSGREVHGVRIEYERSRARHRREGYTAERGGTSYEVAPASVGTASARFAQVVELPEAARNLHFYTESAAMPEKYRHALQRVR
jgi:hypothetical protein